MRFKTLVAYQHFPVIIILILFTALTLYQSITLPLGEADDETDHYQYLRFVARTGHPPFTEAERQEAGFKGGLAPLYYWLTAWPIALVGEDTLPDIRRVDARPERHIPDDGLGINHVLHTLDEQWPWQGQPLAWHIIRFFSLPMGWVTIIATYALVRRLLPERKIVAMSATAFVAFLPRFVISSAVINDDNMVFALTALLILVQVRILQENRLVTGKIMAAFGALFGLSLLTKYFSLILIPEVIFTLVLYQMSRVKSQKLKVKDPPPSLNRSPLSAYYPARSVSHRPRSPLLIFFVTLFVIAGPWFTFIIIRFNRIEELGFIPGLAASLGEPQITEGLVGLLSGQSIRPVAATYTLPEWSSLLYRSFWFEYGWMQIFAPIWIYTLFTVFIALLFLGLIGKIWFNRLTIPQTKANENNQFTHLLRTAYDSLLRPISPTTWLLALHVALFIIVLLIRYILSATIDTGQGRHLYPALPVIALLVALGLNNVHRILSQLPLQERLQRFLPPIGYGLVAACFLLPAATSLLPPFTAFDNSVFNFQPSAFISPHYRTLPVSAIPIILPPNQRQSIEFDNRLWLVGLEATETISAGNTLPVTLYWYAEDEAQRDYLTSLCLQDEKARLVACWRGQFVDGQYPARVWEKGDTIVDTVFIPIPTCDRLDEKSYSLHLELWPLTPVSPTPVLPASPVLQHTFSKPKITIQAADSLEDMPQKVDLWQGNRRLITSTQISLGQSLAQITYAAYNDESLTVFQMTGGSQRHWMPVPQLDTSLYLPCDDGPTPFAHLSHFIVNPTLSNGTYQATTEAPLPDITLSLRDRIFAPVTSTVTFSNTLAPISLHLPNRSPLDLTQSLITNHQSPPAANYQLPTTTPQLPITIRWQARRWMADPLVVSLKLLDKAFAVGGERVATLGDRYPNVLWVPTEIVEATYPLQLKPDAPPGLYQLEISLIRQDEALPDGFEYLPLTDGNTILGQNLYPLTVRLLDPAHDIAPPHPLMAQVGDSIELTGYEMNPIFSDSPPAVSVTLYWQSSRKPPADYTVFVQMVGPDGQMGAQWDNPPQAGRYPTSAWRENDTVIDRYRLSFREDAPPGDYHLLVGMYDSTTGKRLPITIEGQPQSDNAIELTTFSLPP